MMTAAAIIDRTFVDIQIGPTKLFTVYRQSLMEFG